MTHPNVETTIAPAGPRGPRQAGARALITLTLLAGLVATALSGCVVVPAGYRYGPGPGYYRHGYYRDGSYRQGYYRDGWHYGHVYYSDR